MNLETIGDITIIGTSHIAKQSLEEVRQAIENENPYIIALELDDARLHGLMHKKEKVDLRLIKVVGLKGFVFSVFGAWAEKKLGKMVGVSPGSEMREAVKIARKNKIQIALVDQNISITLRRISKELTWREKFNFISDIIKAPFSKPDYVFDLTTVPEKELIEYLVEKLKNRYPSLYKVLIEERNHVIARNLKRLSKENPGKRILAILGAGHIDEVSYLLTINEPDIRYTFSFSQPSDKPNL